MGDKSKIEWTDSTWNPIRGCSRVSEGCRNCYAERVAARFGGPGQPYEGLAKMTAIGPRWTGELRLIEAHIADPIKWSRPRKIFVNSMSDLFHERMKDEWIDIIFNVMRACPHHIFQILTKRTYRMMQYVYDLNPEDHRHIFLGFSAEDQQTFDDRWSDACNIAAQGWNVWLSAEPLLGPIDPYYATALTISCANCGDGQGWIGERCSCGNGVYTEQPTLCWIVAGGESGPGARPMHPQWARKLRDDCVANGIPFLFKQWGEFKPINQMDEAEADSMYKPVPEGWPSDTTRRPRYESTVVLPDGTTGSDYPHGAMLTFRVGKKAAGRLLDGREWSEFPNVEIT